YPDAEPDYIWEIIEIKFIGERDLVLPGFEFAAGENFVPQVAIVAVAITDIAFLVFNLDDKFLVGFRSVGQIDFHPQRNAWELGAINMAEIQNQIVIAIVFQIKIV